MKALCWHGKKDVRIDNVPDPQIINPRDTIIKITSTAICGSDLHLYDNLVQPMMPGDILGHEFMGEVVEPGPAVTNLKKGDRVLIPFNIGCGSCFYCKQQMIPGCDNSNPKPAFSEALLGHRAGGMYGYSHMFGGYAGGQAEYARVVYSDFNAFKVPDGVTDEQVLFLTDIFPTGYQAADNCDIKKGDTVAVWGCGPVGQFAIKSAYLLGAERVIAIDSIPERLDLARRNTGCDIINYEESEYIPEVLKQMTGGRGPDSCIEAVGMEAHGTSIGAKYERVKQAVKLQLDHPTALREAIRACRKGGTVSVPGVYVGYIDKFPYGQVFGKGLTMKGGQTKMHKYIQPLLDKVQAGELDLTYIISHRVPLEQAPIAYKTFCDKLDNCTKVVLKPGTSSSQLAAEGFDAKATM